MNNDLPIPVLITVFTGAFMVLIPHLSPRRYFFAITVPAGFPASAAGRSALRRYYTAVVCSVLIAVAVLAWVALPGEWLPLVAMLIPGLLGMCAFLRERNQVARMVPVGDQIREAELTSDDDRLPGWIVLALPPFALPLAAAAWLRAHWDEIPARYPIHWNIHNTPDGWAEKSSHDVYGPLLFSGGLMLVLILITLAMFYGSRRGRQRTAVMKFMIVTIYFLALQLSALAFLPLAQFSPDMVIVPAILFPLLLIFWAFRMLRDPDMPADQTPDDCWYLGGIYVNAKDPAIFVQKRIGFGYTINMGNRLGWLVMGGFVAAIGGLIFALPR